MKSAQLIIILIFGMVEIAYSSGASRLPVVAVTSFEGRKVDSIDARTLSDALSDNLVRSNKVRVIERMQMNAILQEQGFQSSGACDNEECAVEIGKLLGVSRIVIGSVSKLGRVYSMSVRMVDVQTGEILKSSMRNSSGRIEELLTISVPELAQELVSTKSVNTELAYNATRAKDGADRKNDFIIPAELDSAIGLVRSVGVVISEDDPNDNLSLRPKMYLVNNSSRRVDKAGFSIRIPRDFKNAIAEAVYAPGCESIILNSGDFYTFQVACTKVDLESGEVWPQHDGGIRYDIRSVDGKAWKRKALLGFTKKWSYDSTIKVISK